MRLLFALRQSCLGTYLDFITCATNTTLQTLRLTSGIWRLGSDSLDLQRCADYDDSSKTPCLGGADAGDDGDGYCREGHTGPLCSSCINASTYLNDNGECAACPAVGGRSTPTTTNPTPTPPPRNPPT